MTHCHEKRGHIFVQHPIRSVCAKIKVNCLSRFRTRAHQVFATQKPCPSETPLTMKTATPNSL